MDWHRDNQLLSEEGSLREKSEQVQRKLRDKVVLEAHQGLSRAGGQKDRNHVLFQ